MHHRNSELLDDPSDLLPQKTVRNTYSKVAAINACLSLMFGISLLLIIYNKILGLPSSEVAFIYIYITFGILAFSGFASTIASFVRKEKLVTLKWIAGIVNTMIFIIVILVIISSFQY